MSKVTDGLIAEFYLNTIDDGITYDSSGNAYNSILQPSVDDGPTLVDNGQAIPTMAFDGQNDYLQIEELNFQHSQGIEAITVEAWVKLDQVTKEQQVIASFDDEAYWELSLLSDANGQQIKWSTIDANGGMQETTGILEQEIADGNWRQIIVTYDSTTQAKQIFLDSTLLTEATAHGGIILGAKPSGLGQIGAALEGETSNHFWEGQLSQVRIYSRALSQGEILLNYQSGQEILLLNDVETSYEQAYPIQFMLSNQLVPDTVFLNNNRRGENLQIKIYNDSYDAIKFQLPADMVASETNYHLELLFRPGILTNDSKLSFEVLQSDWDIKSLSHADGTVSLYLLSTSDVERVLGAKIDSTQQGDSNVPDNMILILKGLTVDGDAFSGSTLIELKYGQLSYSGSTPGEPLTGNWLKNIDVVNHQGKKEMPVMVNFLGGNRILNDGTTPNRLTLRLSNPLPDYNFLLIGGENDLASTFEIVFKIGQVDDPWAIATSESAINIIEDQLPAGWTHVVEDQGIDLVYKLSLTEDFEWRAGTHLDFVFEIITGNPSGMTPLMIHYKNIPGFWDGQFVRDIEKTPLLYNEQFVGVGLPKEKIAAQLSLGGDTGANLDGTKLLINGYQSDGTVNQLLVQDDEGETDFVINGKNIGVGLENPEVPLHVKGELRVEDGKIRANKALKFQPIAHTDGTNNIQFLTGDGDHSMRIKSNGDIGMGTTSPEEKVHIKDGNLLVEEGNLTAQNFEGKTVLHATNIDEEVPEEERVEDIGIGKVGIGTKYPQKRLHVKDGDCAIQNGELQIKNSEGSNLVRIEKDGDFKINGEKPIQFVRYTNIGDDTDYHTGYDTDEWGAAIVGFKAQSVDINENDSGTFIKIYMDGESFHDWHIRADLRSHNNNEDWTIDVMYVSRKFCSISGFGV